MNPFACGNNRFARYGLMNTPLCDPTDPNGADIVNTGFSGSHHTLIYEAGSRAGKYAVSGSSEEVNNYGWNDPTWTASGGSAPSCGTYTQVRDVDCIRSIDGQVVDDGLCSINTPKPDTTRIADTGVACTQTAWCGGSIPTNATASTGTGYTQIWSGGTWVPASVVW